MVRQSDAPASIEFGHYSIFPHRRQLFAEGRPIMLGGRAFDVLMALVEASGAVVGKDELLNHVWQGRIVEENRLAGEIAALRKAFGADRELIRTVAGRGYQFTGEIRARPPDVGQGQVLDAAADVASSMIPVGAGSSRPEKPSIAVLPFANMTSDQERKDLTEPAAVALPVPVFHAAVDPVGEAVADIPQPALVLPDKPSIAVLPCTNMSDVEQDFFADGITEDIITALSHYPSLFVVARNSCFTYKGRAIDVKQVACELGVRYVLESSLRRADNRIRITAQLVEADTGKHAWAEQAISPNLAYAHATLGAALIFSGHPKEGLAALERSIRLDPRDPRSAIRLNQRALGLYFSREYPATVEAAKHAVRSYPSRSPARAVMNGRLGRIRQSDRAPRNGRSR